MITIIIGVFEVLSREELARRKPSVAVLRDFKDTVYIHYSNQIPCSSNVVFVLCLAVQRLFESRDA